MRSARCLLLLMVLGGMSAWAQSQVPPYDPASAVDLSGAVDEIREVSEPAAAKGVHLTLRVGEQQSFDCFLGPASFVREFDEVYAKGNRIDVKGWKVKFGTSLVIVTREIRKGDMTLSLRDRQGRPLWVPISGRPAT